MPTDLPKNFSGTSPLEPDRKAIRKVALKSARQSLWAIAKALTLHYGITLAAVAVVAAAGFHGTFRAALSATALGLLARWFLPNKATQQAFQKPPLPFQPAGVVEMTPEQLREFFANLPKSDGAADAAPGPSPYM